MSRCLEFLRQLGRDEEGTALIEYTILLGVIAIAVIALATAIGAWVKTEWSSLCSGIAGSTTMSGNISCP